MGIPIEKSFVVKAPAAAVWEFLTDPVKVASCLPGAAITGKEEDGQTWGGTMTVKVGPVTASYRGKLRFERLDAAAREAEIVASGQETRGKGGADMRMKSRVVERAPGETEVTVSSDVNVVGVLAQFGRGMIQDVSDQIFLKFTEGMRRQLEGESGASGPPGGEAATDRGAPAPAAGPASVAPGSGAVPAAPTAPAAPAVIGAPAVPASGAAPAATAVPATSATVSAPATPATPATSAAPAASAGSGGGVAPRRPESGSAPPAGGMAGAGKSPGAAEDNVLDVGAIGAAAFGRAAARALRRPAFWIAVAVAGLVVYWLAIR
jgi:carbon monoxide dehydrogenase subunit G